MEDLEKILTDHFYKELEESEGITKEDLELVDFDIAFTPVIQFKGGHPVEVTETVGGNYIIHGEFPMTVNSEQLKVMRYRYLSNRNNPFEHLFK